MQSNSPRRKPKVGRVLSIDLACTRTRNCGVCLLETLDEKEIRARFLSPDELGLLEPPDTSQFAAAIKSFCQRKNIFLVMIDGPQGWKDPNSGLKHSRLCERLLNAPAKTGVKGEVKPKSYTAFVSFSIGVFQQLRDLGAVLAKSPAIEAPSKGLLAAETLPLAAWRSLGIPSLPAKKKATEAHLRDRLLELMKMFLLKVARNPSHDELQALVSGLAGTAILSEQSDGYVAIGQTPSEHDGVIVEGFIVNPRNKHGQSKGN